MFHNINTLSLHCVFHGIRFKVNEDWESGKIPFFYLSYFTIYLSIFLKKDRLKFEAVLYQF